jgi:hypothetical protein
MIFSKGMGLGMGGERKELKRAPSLIPKSVLVLDSQMSVQVQCLLLHAIESPQ